MIAEVIVDIATASVDKVFDYQAIDGLCAGHRVLVPFGARTTEGYVVALKERSELKDSQIKSVIKILDDYPVLLPELLSLACLLAEENHLKKVDSLRLMIPAEMRAGRIKELRVNKLRAAAVLNKQETGDKFRKGATSQFKLLDFLEPNKVYLQAELNKKFSPATVDKFVELNLLTRFSEEERRAPLSGKAEKQKLKLTAAQAQAVNTILSNGAKTHLLFGVTGSGKTEVYIRIISRAAAEGKTAILLVPEISLTPQVLGLFRNEFNDNVAILHSRLSAGERFDEWRRIRQNEAKIVIGARSAIFAPLTDIGVIIIDEEHDSSYKSESNPRYSTVDVAELRAKHNNCPLVLGSATPALESFYSAKTGKFNLIELNSRINNKDMPAVQIVDMTNEIKAGNTGFFSSQLLKELMQCVESGNQAMLFINRRGFASFMMCRECGYVAQCSDCDVSLVYHREEEVLKCHYCNKRFRALTNCPNCKSSYIRQGATGTQRVVAELAKLFPDVPVLRMDNDTTRSKDAHLKILEEFARFKPSILVGTQMIAKGHDFPSVTLVGILDADISLHFSDFRSTERTYQLITQVAGRAGRGEKEGKVVLQTYTPKHYVYRFAANYNYKGFYEKEINLREVTKFPPFAQLVRILISSENETQARDFAFDVFNNIKMLRAEHKDEFLFCEAMRSPVGRMQNKHRYQILMRFKLDYAKVIMQKIYSITDANFNPKVLCFVEINPSNLN